VSEENKRGKSKFAPFLDSRGKPVEYLIVYQPTGMIYVRKTFKKMGIPPLFTPTGETAIGAAKTARDVLMQRHINRHLGIQDDHVFGRATVKPFRRAAMETLAIYTPTVRWRTRIKHKHYIEQLIGYIGNTDIESIDPDYVRKMVTHFRRTKKKRRKFFEFVKHLNLVMSFAFENTIDGKRFLKARMSFANPDKASAPVGRCFTKRERAGLWQAAGTNLRDQIILVFECLMRPDEFFNLTWTRLELKTGKVTLGAEHVKTGSKTGMGREFILSPNALKRMRARRRRQRDNEKLVFPSPIHLSRPIVTNRGAWAKCKSKAGLTGVARFYDWRHTGLTIALVIKRRNPIAVSEYCGTAVGTLQRTYLHSKARMTRDVSTAVEIEE